MHLALFPFMAETVRLHFVSDYHTGETDCALPLDDAERVIEADAEVELGDTLTCDRCFVVEEVPEEAV